jgi:hypothetical protein
MFPVFAILLCIGLYKIHKEWHKYDDTKKFYASLTIAFAVGLLLSELFI